jgi:hypothetical protein
MNELSQRNARPARATPLVALGVAAGCVLALAACAHGGPDDVKPTATTAYHSVQPATPPSPGTTAPPQPRQ